MASNYSSLYYSFGWNTFKSGPCKWMFWDWFCDYLDRNEKEARDAFNASVDGGLTFFDTAEVYGSRVSIYIIFSPSPFDKHKCQ